MQSVVPSFCSRQSISSVVISPPSSFRNLCVVFPISRFGPLFDINASIPLNNYILLCCWWAQTFPTILCCHDWLIVFNLFLTGLIFDLYLIIIVITDTVVFSPTSTFLFSSFVTFFSFLLLQFIKKFIL